MRVFIPKYHHLHHPSEDLSDGLPGVEHPEVSERVTQVLAGIQIVNKNVEVEETESFAKEAVYQLHDKEYVDFLFELSELVKAKKIQYIPSMFRQNIPNAPLFVQGSLYCKEIGTPIGYNTIDAALNSASSAQHAAEFLIQTEENVTVALCRPPGHHAGYKSYAGYCFFNNAYIAAKVLAQHGKTAVIDIDYHIGDGSIEFASEKIPYFSLHADPYVNYPYLNLNHLSSFHNVYLEHIQTPCYEEKYLALLDKMVEQIKEKQLDYAVLSVGFDALEGDKVQDGKIFLPLAAYEKIGEKLKGVAPKILVLLEGGYNINQLQHCAMYFFKSLLG